MPIQKVVLFFNNVLELEVEAGAYFKKGDVLISTLGNPFIYNGIINREEDMGCIYGISAYGEITSEEVPIWTSVCGEDKSKYVRLATEEEKKSFAERIANTDLDTGDATWLHQSYCCDHCVNHWGIGLCGCGSGQKVGKCECGSQKAHDILGVKYDSFGAILKNFG